DVVGKNLQLRLGVDGRVLRQEQHLVGLLGIGLLGVLANENLAVENPVRFSVQDALVQFVAGAARLGVVDGGEVVDVLAAARQVQTVDGGLAALAVELNADFVADQSAAQRQKMRFEIAAAVQAHLRGGNVVSRQTFALELVMVNDRTFAGHDLGDGIGQIAIVLQAQVNLDDLQSAALANNDQIARMRGNGFAAGPGDENKVNGLFQD